MVLVTFTIGMINLCLGFAVAMHLGYGPPGLRQTWETMWSALPPLEDDFPTADLSPSAPAEQPAPPDAAALPASVEARGATPAQDEPTATRSPELDEKLVESANPQTQRTEYGVLSTQY
jgi:hypothetical protein